MTAATPGHAAPAMPDSAVLRAAILATEVPASGTPLEWTDRGHLDGIIASWIGRELPPGTPPSVAASAAQRVTAGLAPFVEAEALRLAQAALAAQQPHAADGCPDPSQHVVIRDFLAGRELSHAETTGPQPAPALAAAAFPAAQAALARVLSWFAEEPVVSSRRYASATRAQLANAYQDGELTVPEELRRYQ